MSLVAGIQPEPLGKFISESTRDGLLARMSFVWPDPVPICAEELDELDWLSVETQVERAFRRLATLRCAEPTVLPLSATAKDRFSAWRVDYLSGARERHPDEMPAHMAKAPGNVARLALCHSMLTWALCGAQVPREIADEHVAAAIEYRRYLDAHYQRTLADSEEPEPERLARELARWIMRERPKVINTLTLRREVRLPGLRSEARLKLALEELRLARWITTDIPRSSYDPLPRIVHLSDPLLDFLHPEQETSHVH
jgi:regulator of sigma D